MTPERLQQVSRIYHDALVRDTSEREAFVRQACGDDEAMRQEVESLLAQPASAEDFLGEPAMAMAARLMQPDAATSLLTGRRIGPYQLLDLLGAGGMGEVYRARDTRLGREVAVKVLPRLFSADPERLARFQREARLLALLNHPHIAAIYGVEEADGVHALVLELVEGPTLAERLQHGPVPVVEALTIAHQIADALEAAHEKGIVHRDLKPGNIKVKPDGTVKVLDFGLAKAAAADPAGQNFLQAPTTGLTREGIILGTARYMSPEQARGHTVDKRTDIWAFGCVLYEMLTGRTAFAGETISDTIAAILEREPDLSKLPATTSSGVRRLLPRCLVKDLKRRLRDIGDAHADLDDAVPIAAILSAPAVPRPSRSWAVAAALTIAVAAGVLGALVWRDRNARPESPAVSFTAIPLTTYQGREQQPAFSPDGNSVAFIWNGETEDNWDIYVKLIGPGSPQRLTTDAAMDLSPAWSPDGRSIAFVRVRDGRFIVIVVPSRGGPEREVLETLKVGGIGFGQVLSWSADSRILVIGASPSVDTPEVLMAEDVATGETRPVTTPPPFPNSDALPSVSPNGRMLAFVRRSGVLTGELYVQALSAGFAPVGEPRRLRTDGRFYHGVAWTADGRDVIVSSGNQGDVGLWRIPLRSPEQIERLSPSGDEWRQPAVAMQRDRLAFTRARWDDNIWSLALSAPGRPAGSPVKLIGSTRSERNARFSPDGTRVVFEGQGSGTQEVWVADRDGRNALQLTSFNGGQGGTAAWSPDGKSIAYDLRNEDGRGDIYVIPARSGAPLRITTHPADDLVPSWSRDGRFIYFGSNRSGTSQIWKQSPQGGEPVQVTQHGGQHGKESVDGRYLYYSRTSSFLASLWRVPVSGGEEVQVLREIAGVLNFAVARDGIYFEASPPSSPLGHIAMLTPFTRPETILDFLSFATGKVTRVITLDRRAAIGLDVSPDGRTLLFAQSDSFTEDLMLVENFR